MDRIVRFFRQISVEPVMFLYMIAYHVETDSLYKDMTHYKICQQEYNDTVCDNLAAYDDANNYVEDQSSYWLEGGKIAEIIPSLIATIYLGSWIDISSLRKLSLILPPLGLTISTLVFLFMSVDYYSRVWLIIPGYIILGIFGGATGNTTTCFSYVVQDSEEGNRTIRISLVKSMSHLAGAIGQFISGAIMSAFGRTYTLVFFLAINLVNIVYILVFIKNSSSFNLLPKESNSCCGKYFSVQHLKDGVTTPFKKRAQSARKILFLLLFTYLWVQITLGGANDILYLYAVDTPLSWSATTWSYFYGYRYGLDTIALVVLIPVGKYLGISDIVLCVIGSFAQVAENILTGLAYNNIMMLFGPLLGMMQNFNNVCLRSLIAVTVGESEQGKIISSESILENIASLVASLIYNTAYPATRSIFKGLLFEVTAASVLIPLIIYGYLILRSRRITKTEVDAISTHSSAENSEKY